MKIAIMTQPLGRNYGGLMQAWALQQALIKNGHEVTTINRVKPSNKTKFNYCLRIISRVILKIFQARKRAVFFEKDRYKNTEDFILNKINHSEQILSTCQLSTHFKEHKYDAVIVGSDQTWRPCYSPEIKNFFLDFLINNNIKKYAYAASFGVDDWEYSPELTNECRLLAKKFDRISVRESSAVRLCQEHLDVHALHVLDPTLLLNELDYYMLVGKQRLKDNPSGIYTYILDKTEEKEQFCQKASVILCESLYSCQAIYNEDRKQSNNKNDYDYPRVEDWLAGFANAKFIITDSFHGMIFATIFKKPFIVINNKERGSARFNSLLKLTGNSDNLITDISTEFDFTDFDKRSFTGSTEFEEAKEKSLSYISSI